MTAFIALVALFTGVVVVVTVITRIGNDKRLRTKLSDGFGKPPALGTEGTPESLENIESIRRYAEVMDELEPGPWRLDATTWNDLDMDKVFGRINVCQSSVGEEYLYNCLHELQQNDATLREREKLIQFFADRPEDRLAVQVALAKIGKENYNGLSRLLFNADARYVKYQRLYTLMAYLPLVAAAFMFVYLPAGFLALFASFVANIAVRERVKNKLESEMPAIEYLHLMLACCKRLCAMDTLQGLPTIEALRHNFVRFKPLVNKLPAAQNKGTLMDFDFIMEYIRVMFLVDIRNYNRLVRSINEYNKEFHGLIKAVGETETALCVLNFRLTLPVWCVPDFTPRAALSFTDLIHPLLATPVANDGEIPADTLLTGSNASGKSTFVKALALGGVLAQTLYTCAAKHFTLRFSWILTSMVMRDDIGGGDSYFIVEIKSLKRILERVRAHPCTCYIDEILRGTNTVERIAASVSVLSWLHGRDCLTLAATHDIELTHLLAEKYDNYHFREQVTSDGVLFDYKLKPGPSTTRNALKLLETMGFDAKITAQAREMAQGYDATQRW